MSESPAPTNLPVAVKAQRERTITALCDHFSNDRLTVEEFERRLDVANRALTVPELDTLLSDLPAVAETSTPVSPAMATQTTAAPTKHFREQQTLVAVMGGVDRRGRWQPARQTLVIAVMGGAALDFREVQLPPGETELTLLCVMGGAEVIVPPGMNVDTSGVAIMGGFAHRHDQPPVSGPDASILKINGFALMGGVDLQVRLPGESSGDARDRQREQRRRLKDERRRR
jgi:hypothetical protein